MKAMTKEEKEKRYWIVPGIHVRSRDLPDVCLTVDRLDGRKKTTGEEAGKFRLLGVICSWEENGETRTRSFHSRDLSPW